MLKILLIVFIFFVGLMVLFAIKSGKLTVKYSLIWFFSVFLMMIALLTPNLLEKLAVFFGFEVVSNMLFLFSILILFSMVFSLSVIVSSQHDKIKMLIQEISMLKKKSSSKK